MRSSRWQAQGNVYLVTEEHLTAEAVRVQVGDADGILGVETAGGIGKKRVALGIEGLRRRHATAHPQDDQVVGGGHDGGARILDQKGPGVPGAQRSQGRGTQRSNESAAREISCLHGRNVRQS